MVSSNFTTISNLQLFTCSKQRNPLENMSAYIEGGFVEWNADNDGPKMTCEIQVMRPDLFRAIADFVYLEFDLQRYGEAIEHLQFGPFRLAFPGEENHVPSGTKASIRGEDVSILLDKSVIMGKKTDRVGTNYGVAIKNSLLQVLGPSRVDVRDTDRVISQPFTHYRGETERDRSAKLTEAISWYQPFMTLEGKLQTLPYRDFSKVQPLGLWDDSLIVPPVKRIPPPAGDIFNVVIVQRDRGDAAPLVSIRENNDPRSNVSIPSLDGQREIKRISNSTAETQDDITAASRNILQEGAMRYEGLSFQLAPRKAWLGIYQAVNLQMQTLTALFEGLYHLRRWRISFVPTSALMDVDVYRIVELDI